MDLYEKERLEHPEFFGKIYMFFRKEGFYPIELGSDEQAIENALCNPGTLRVENSDHEVIWVLN